MRSTSKSRTFGAYGSSLRAVRIHSLGMSLLFLHTQVFVLYIEVHILAYFHQIDLSQVLNSDPVSRLRRRTVDSGARLMHSTLTLGI